MLASEAGDDLIIDEDHVVAIADVAQPWQIVGRRHDETGRGDRDRLDNDGGHRLRVLRLDRAFDELDAGAPAGRIRLVERTAVTIGRMHVDEARAEGLEHRLRSRPPPADSAPIVPP